MIYDFLSKRRKGGGHTVMQRGQPGDVSRVQWTLVVEEEVHHGHGADGGGSVQG